MLIVDQEEPEVIQPLRLEVIRQLVGNGFHCPERFIEEPQQVPLLSEIDDPGVGFAEPDQVAPLLDGLTPLALPEVPAGVSLR